MEEDGKAWMRRPWVWPWAPRVMGEVRAEVRVSIDRVFETSLRIRFSIERGWWPRSIEPGYGGSNCGRNAPIGVINLAAIEASITEIKGDPNHLALLRLWWWHHPPTGVAGDYRGGR
ncbi:hypothetical protein CRG98_032470 [Punica granatum]|uniref:Uncharacterized protein n=1 Tax=Punica granatum TaxID=22663 RepID=A0A2I0ISZ0_PUNGR|nr:hypothetical protein CRG98_032470 [Punica granatum]